MLGLSSNRSFSCMPFKERIKGEEMKSRYNVSAYDEVFGTDDFLNILENQNLEWNQLFEGLEIFSNTFI